VTMMMPGFTAENSLYPRPERPYIMAGRLSDHSRSKAAITPAYISKCSRCVIELLQNGLDFDFSFELCEGAGNC